jgi:TetR/AcrR family transcriptional regulator, cholesterol catabolism regulator
MGSTSITSLVSIRRTDTRFERRLAEILEHGTAVFYEKGYEGASMRDLSRMSGMSLAGLYYYFESKEKLLYLIQKHYFTTVVERLSQRLEGASGAEERLRTFILNHLQYFLAENHKAMKVLAHEDDVLEGELGTEIRSLKRRYYHSCADLVEVLKHERGLEFNLRVAVMSLFGTMNWLHTWYNPRIDPDATSLARQVGDTFLRGLYAATRSS